MGMTMTQKILAKHAGVASVALGGLIVCNVDMVLANDITAPPAIAEFKKIGRPVFDKTKIALVLTAPVLSTAYSISSVACTPGIS